MTWHLSGKPYEVQRAAGEAASMKPGFAYFLEQGLGKTGVIFNEIVDLAWKDEINGALVLCPKTLMMNWFREADKMGFKGQVFVWPNWPAVDKLPKDQPWVLMMNFEALITTKGENALEALYTVHQNRLYFAIDESSRIKNPSAKRTKQALHWAARAMYVRIGSGTPITQNVGDLWAQLKAIGATKLRFFPFRNKFAKMGGYMGREIVGVADPEGLQALMEGCTMFAKKKDWTDLPEKQYVLHDVPMASVQKKAYKEMYEDMLTLVGETKIEAPLALTSMKKLQQITSGFINDEEGRPIPLFPSVFDIPKFIHLMDVREESSKKQIFFVENIWTLTALYEIIAKQYPAGRTPAVVMGASGMKARGITSDDEVHRFNNDPNCRDAIIQIQAGGIGLTLLGQPGDDRCSVVHYPENTFSLESRLQSEDRPHRHGQDEMVTYHDYASAPIDRRCAMALQKKENIADVVQSPLIWKPDF